MRGSWKVGAVAAGLVLLAGCGITENMTDLCDGERRAYDAAARFSSGVTARQSSATSATVTRTTERLTDARDRLGACEVKNRRS